MHEAICIYVRHESSQKPRIKQVVYTCFEWAYICYLTRFLSHSSHEDALSLVIPLAGNAEQLW